MTEQLYRESRFAGMDFLLSADELHEIKRQVDAAFARTFGDSKSLTSEEYDIAGFTFAQHIKEHGWDARTPQDCPAWNARIGKARREIEEHKTECQLRVLASAITVEQILNDIEEIRSWANSLRKVQSEHGWNV